MLSGDINKGAGPPLYSFCIVDKSEQGITPEKMLSLESLFFQTPSNIREQERKPEGYVNINGIQEVVGSIPISSTI